MYVLDPRSVYSCVSEARGYQCPSQSRGSSTQCAWSMKQFVVGSHSAHVGSQKSTLLVKLARDLALWISLSRISLFIWCHRRGEKSRQRKEKKKKRITWRLRCMWKDTALDEGWEIRTRAGDSPKMPHFMLARGEDSRHRNEVDWPVWAWIRGWDQQVSQPQWREQRHCFVLFRMGLG